MKKLNRATIQEFSLGLGIILLVILLLNPFEFWMPGGMLIALMAGVLVLFSLFVHFIWKTQTGDERDTFHQFLMARSAYVVGCAVLITGVLFQSRNHQVDPWLVLALGAMILAKISTSYIARQKY